MLWLLVVAVVVLQVEEVAEEVVYCLVLDILLDWVSH
jgi:hypothetical protein